MHENEMNKRGDPLLLISSRLAVLEKYPQITLSWKLNLILKGCCLRLFASQIINKYLEFLEQDTVKKMGLFRRWLRHAHGLFLPQKTMSWHMVITCLFVYLFYVHCFSEEYCIYHQFFNWVHSLHTESMNASHSTNLFTNSCDHIFTNGKAPLHSHINHNNPQFLCSLWRRANARNVSFPNLSRW